MKQDALTTLETLVAIVIVGILAALLLPVFRGMFDRADAVNCAAGIRQFGAAALLYRSEHNGFLPPGELIPPITSENENPQSGVDVKGDLLDGGYLKVLPYCPSSRLTAKGKEYIKTKKITPKEHFQNKGSYAINAYLAQVKLEALPGHYWPVYPYPGDSRMLFVAEAYFCGLTWSFYHQNAALDGFDTGQIFIGPRDHGNHQLHFMFVDGHVERLAPKVTGKDSNGANIYDWTDAFDSWGRNGKYIQARRARSSE